MWYIWKISKKTLCLFLELDIKIAQLFSCFDLKYKKFPTILLSSKANHEIKHILPRKQRRPKNFKENF